MAGPRKARADGKPPAAEKRAYFKQADFPEASLQQAQKIASALVDNYAGKDASPPDLALVLGISPTVRSWPTLTGSAIAYGLTEGGVNASKIKLLGLGRKLVSPEAEGEDLTARREAILKPRILREFFERYRRAKFPVDAVAGNVLKSLGLPPERVESALEIVKANGRYAGIIRDTPTGPFVNLDSPGVPAPTATPEIAEHEDHAEPEKVETPPGAQAGAPPRPAPPTPGFDPKSNRVFISHGKRHGIVGQLKELLTFGSFEPVVSVERESTAIPVPEKVFEDMRSCGAGVIHVGAEGSYLDRDGKEHSKINDNVLIEIGAAMALYGKKVVLLVEKGVALPSNLQGLYRCDFEGDRLDYESTMKLLKTFSQFR
ncbi:MAG TPA: TIR domain-containing protein [Vicinamibacteria bacterium]|jgi:predicted nucleotide-binding protein|nr:TIR domain-containing protein [Vicinamibacteria bacterium]